MRLRTEGWNIIGGGILILMLSLSILQTEAAGDEKMNLNIFGEIDRKLKIFHLQAPDLYMDNLMEVDQAYIFDFKFEPEGFDDADLAVVFLSEWKAAQHFPESMSEIKEQIIGSPKERITQLVALKRNNGSPLAFIFYNKKHTDKMNVQCLSRDLVNLLTLSNKEYRKVNISNCLNDG